MKVAVISDIHGNLEAFREVLADIDKIGADSIICLGDLIGYGPNPEEVVQLLRSRSIPSIMGNHELALARADFLDWFNETARESLVLSESLISAETRNWLRDLDATLVFEEALFVHGCPPDSITEYIFELDDEGLEEIFSKMDNQICFVGHTHTLEAILFADATVRHHSLREGIFTLDSQAKYIISVGSVGQPRDGYNNNAKYALWNTIQKSVEIRFVPYDISKTAEKIISLGFPGINATRLW
ncbi:MAG: metallophosphoesterase [Syntrophobacteraceae bacterium]